MLRHDNGGRSFTRMGRGFEDSTLKKAVTMLKDISEQKFISLKSTAQRRSL